MADAFSALQKLSASFLNNLFKGSAGWEPYTPVMTGGGVAITLGNGSLSGAYAKAGRTTHYRIDLTIGSTTVIPAGTLVWTVPTTPTGVGWSGGLRVIDVSPAQQFYRHVFVNTGNQIAAAAEGAGTFVSNTVPITPAVGDSYQIRGFYESTT